MATFLLTSFLYYKCFVLQVFGITSCLYYSFFVLQVAQKVKNRINLEPTWANLSQLEPTCGPKWPNGAAHAHAYCIIRAGNGNCWASVSATINLYFKHVTCSQDTLKMASWTQTKKIHVPIGLWIFMVSIVRNSLKFWLGLKSLWLKPVTDEITPVSLLIHWSCGFAGAW